MSGLRPLRTLMVAATATVVVAAGGAAVAAGPANAATAGSMTVLENTGYIGDWSGLDPATNTDDVANTSYMDAIYGDLFEQGPNNQPIPDLATGYKFSDGGKTVTITLRSGVTFTDGTPFNAAAVKYNILRDIAPSNADACQCATDFPISTITTPNNLTVVLHLTKVYAPIIGAFFNNAPNWIASPTALKKMGETAFALNPVGAGPFTVVSDKPSASLQLKANPGYWQKGHPELSTLTFTTIGSDESAFEALQAGQAQAYQRFQTYSLVAQVKKKLQVHTIPPTQAGVIQLNTKHAPFNNPLAREATYYATDSAAINKSLIFGLGTVTQSLTGPGGLFYEPTVPGYRSYNVAKAKALVKQIGGLSPKIITVGTPFDQELAIALKSQWAAAGINATVSVVNVGQAIAQYRAGSWEIGLPVAGDFDPGLGTGLSSEYLSTGALSGIDDPTLDKMINAAAGTIVNSKRSADYKQIFQYISNKAYSPFTPVAPVYNLATAGVSGPGLTTNAPEIFWEDVKA
jgi:peptide/nickel transport system substrate-binding protein